MTTVRILPALAEQVAAVPGVSTIYVPRSIAAMAADLGIPVPRDTDPQIVVVDRAVRLRVGIDRSRAAGDIARDIHQALRTGLIAEGLEGARIDLEIATIR